MSADRFDGPSHSQDPGEAAFGEPLGQVVGGSLSDGVEVRLEGGASVEDVQVGSYVTIRGERKRFFGMVGEVRLASADRGLGGHPPGPGEGLLARALAGTAAYGSITVRPRLELPAVAGVQGLRPARSIPSHFSPAFRASEADVAQVFGREDRDHFEVGTPLDMDTKVCLDMQRFAQRSNGVFGKSGTGKSFLTRLLLIGLLQKTDAACLVFDMHGEYGWQGQDVERRHAVKGLKGLFGNRVAVFTMDEEGSRRRGVTFDAAVRLGLQEVEPEDLEVMAPTLGITPAGVQAVQKLPGRLGREAWLKAFLALESSDDLGALAESMGEPFQTVSALRRRLEPLRRLPFLTSGPAGDHLARLQDHLERGDHVVLEFGRYGGNLHAYMLVANILTRRIHDRYVQRTEEAEGGGGPRPRSLVIVIEEAHRFLGPQVSSQTIFATIAREMRKYSVTLLVVDQRPSAIDREVLSQIGTKLCCLLEDERDVDAVMEGASGSRELRAVLAGLESRQQALIFGDAVPIPVAVRVREYGSAASYAALGTAGARRGSPRPAGDAGATADDDPLFG